jgi:hypothetical protein
MNNRETDFITVNNTSRDNHPSIPPHLHRRFNSTFLTGLMAGARMAGEHRNRLLSPINHPEPVKMSRKAGD